jgi:hypothetical protein
MPVAASTKTKDDPLVEVVVLAEERDVPGDLLVDLEVEERAALDVERHRLRPVGREVVVGVAARGGCYEMSAGAQRERGRKENCDRHVLGRLDVPPARGRIERRIKGRQHLGVGRDGSTQTHHF